MSLFSQESEVLHSGAMMARVLAPGYILLVFCQIFIGIVRGCGHTFATMILSVVNLCGLRIIWLAALLPLFPFIFFFRFQCVFKCFLDWETCAKIDSKIRCIDEFWDRRRTALYLKSFLATKKGRRENGSQNFNFPVHPFSGYAARRRSSNTAKYMRWRYPR